MNECTFVVKKYCYNKSGTMMEKLSPHLPLGENW